ncbi:hypothetical protein OIDMADRAFT_107026 [Oidiodendron maius Zn]|uniref:NADP-dependent oxidoreductase domain-containing protein n=1 Tax=Oidiodendron maius (strain Zn) TaxID=913774 RepID=A0A0C3G9S6_OIDMZ|nr:hypothetical protein OIDMADRAFT_107026 [Oidiodendron maius Zn]
MTTTIVDKVVGQNGLGLMRLTDPVNPMPDEAAFKVLKAALAEGVTLWNGADFYGTPEHNSLHLLASYFATYPEDADKVVVCIKSGVVDMRRYLIDGSPECVRRLVVNANNTLRGHKKIDLFGIGRVDKNTPIEDTVGALAELVAEGAIGGIQLSEVGAATIRRATAVAKIDMVEEEVSLWAPEIFDNGVATTCAELGILIVAHTPLGAGMLAGKWKTADDGHHRAFPRFQGKNFDKNLELVSEVAKLAKAKGVTPGQLALSWIKAQSNKPGMPFIIPISGTRSPERMRENTTTVELSGDDLKAITDILASFPIHGTRYPEAGMKLVDF